MISCEEFTAELLNDGQTEPDTQMRVVNRLKNVPPRIYTYYGPCVTAEYINEHGFLDINRFCQEVVFHDAGCDDWRSDWEKSKISDRKFPHIDDSQR